MLQSFYSYKICVLTQQPSSHAQLASGTTPADQVLYLALLLDCGNKFQVKWQLDWSTWLPLSISLLPWAIWLVRVSFSSEGVKTPFCDYVGHRARLKIWSGIRMWDIIYNLFTSMKPLSLWHPVTNESTIRDPWAFNVNLHSRLCKHFGVWFTLVWKFKKRWLWHTHVLYCTTDNKN